MAFQKKAETQELDNKIEELKAEKEKIEAQTEQEISQFNSLYLFTNNNLNMLHERVMRIELWIAEISAQPQEAQNQPHAAQQPAEEVPQTLPPLNTPEFVKSEKQKGGLFRK